MLRDDPVASLRPGTDHTATAEVYGTLIPHRRLPVDGVADRRRAGERQQAGGTASHRHRECRRRRYDSVSMEGADLQRHRVGSAHHPIRCQRSTLTAGVASEPGHSEIRMDICAVRDGELVGVGRHRQLHLTIGQHAHTPTISADHQPSLSGLIRQATVAHPLTIPHALGLREGDKLLRHAARVLPDEGTGLPVGVVIPRAATIVGVAVELARQPH